MTLQDVSEKILAYLAKLAREKYTGKLVFTLHFRQGGIGRTEVEIKHELHD